jgi:glycosyltransferase involved in cell wall biosynthesis
VSNSGRTKSAPIKVGVCVPILNSLPWVENLITSIEAQTYRPFNLYFVVDRNPDGTDDGTWDFMACRWGNYSLTRNDVHLGWPASLNRAAHFAIDHGCDALFVANADDWLRLDCLEKAVAALPGHDWVNVYGQQVGGRDVVMESIPPISLRHLADHTPCTNFALITSRAWQKVGGYAEDLGLTGLGAGYEDWEFWVRMVKARLRGNVVKEPVYYYRMHEGQLHRLTTARHDEAVDLIMRRHPDLARIAKRQSRP